MNQIVQLVAQKANISEDAAKTAVEVVVNLLKSKLPAPIAAQIESIVSGAAVGNVLNNAGDVVKNAGDVTKSAGDVVKGASDVTKSAGDVVKGAGDVTKSTGALLGGLLGKK